MPVRHIPLVPFQLHRAGQLVLPARPRLSVPTPFMPVEGSNPTHAQEGGKERADHCQWAEIVGTALATQYSGSGFDNSAGLTKARPWLAERPFRIPLRKKRCYNMRFVLDGILT